MKIRMTALKDIIFKKVTKLTQLQENWGKTGQEVVDPYYDMRKIIYKNWIRENEKSLGVPTKLQKILTVLKLQSNLHFC